MNKLDAEAIEPAGLGDEAFLRITTDKAILLVRRGNDYIGVQFDAGEAPDGYPRDQLEAKVRALFVLFSGAIET